MTSPLAGLPVPASQLIDVTKLISAYYSEIPDSHIPEQAVKFGTSGHRGCSLDKSFNETHIQAICQAICEYRAQHGISGPLFLGIDTHALSAPAMATALEVLAANGVEVMIAANNEYTPTPAVSFAILKHNNRRKMRLADGIVITPSHNPPRYGGIKYNLPNGGPAHTKATSSIEVRANQIMKNHLSNVSRISFDRALNADTTHEYDFLNSYVSELDRVVNMAAIHNAGIRMGVDPLGGAGTHYWPKIAEHYKLDLTITSQVIDPTFRFMTADWDGQIRMDPSSPYAMAGLIKMKDEFDIAFACDTDYDRHGIITPGCGLLPANHYLAVALHYLFAYRPQWNKKLQVGKTVVTTQLIDLICKRIHHEVLEMPVGFKWFATGLFDETMAFGGEESAGACFLRMDGRVWTTDKDGIVPALLSAEISATTEQDPGAMFRAMTVEFGTPFEDRIEAPASRAQMKILNDYDPEQLRHMQIAGDKIDNVMSVAPGNGMPIGGFKVVMEGSWFAVRPSGTEAIYKIYAESFKGADHLEKILLDAKWIVDEIFRSETVTVAA